MAHRLTIVDLPLRLLQPCGVRACYRPLAIGHTALRRHVADGPWWVPVSADGTLRPLPPPVAAGRPRRLPEREAVALLTPEDMAARGRRRIARRRDSLPGLPGGGDADIYGWCLLYQPPGMHGIAIVDPHDTVAELPAFFELPLELIDRSEHLARRGVRSRALALLVRPDDFAPSLGDEPARNRFFPDLTVAPPGRPHQS